MQVTLKKVFREQKASKKDGKPYTSLRILTEEHDQRWLSGFGNEGNNRWKEGDCVEIDVTENGEYLNFTTPRVSRNEDVLEALREIYALIEKVLDTVGAKYEKKDKLPF